MEATTKKKLKWGIGIFLFLLLLAGGIYYFGYSETAKKKKLIKQIQEAEKDFTEERKDILKEMTLEELTALLKSLTGKSSTAVTASPETIAKPQFVK